MSTSALPSLIKTFELPSPEIGFGGTSELFYRSPYGPEVIVRDLQNVQGSLVSPRLIAIADFSDSLVPIVTIPDGTTVLDILKDPFMSYLIRVVGYKATGSFVQIKRDYSEALKVLHGTSNLYFTSAKTEYF